MKPDKLLQLSPTRPSGTASAVLNSIRGRADVVAQLSSILACTKI
jgi:hypothetical protein